MDFSDYQKLVDCWIKNEGVRYFNHLTNMAILTEEVGELARVMARKYGEQSCKEGEQNLELADEIADILWVVTAIANQSGVDITTAITQNLEKKNKRDKTRHKNNAKLK